MEQIPIPDYLREKLNAMGGIDKVESGVARSLLQTHIIEYFASDEPGRVRAVRAIESAIRENVDVLADANMPGGQWRHKWPLSARNAILALWRTPRDEPM